MSLFPPPTFKLTSVGIKPTKERPDYKTKRTSQKNPKYRPYVRLRRKNHWAKETYDKTEKT